MTYTRNTYVEFGWACLLAGLVAILYSAATGVILWISAILLAAILLLPTQSIRMRAVDWGVLLLGALEIPSLIFSQYRANSIRGTVTIAIFALVYCATRLTIRTNVQVACLGGLFGMAGSWLAFSGLSRFGEHVKRLDSAGLANLVAFRSRLISPPNTWIPGEWFTLLLLALPLAFMLPAYLLQKQRRWLAATPLVSPVLIAATLCLSLSRAVFWSIVVFCFIGCAFLAITRLVTLRTAGILVGIALITLVLILIGESALYPGVLKAYAGHHSSQVRSAQGRFEIWDRSLEVARNHVLWGVGSGNAALALTSTADQEETTGFASRTFSLPVQFLVEKGVIGFLIYCSFLVLVAREFIRTIRYSRPTVPAVAIGCSANSANGISRCPTLAKLTDLSVRKAMTCFLAAGLIAVLSRELTYSSLFEHQLTGALVAVLTALICLQEPIK